MRSSPSPGAPSSAPRQAVRRQAEVDGRGAGSPSSRDQRGERLERGTGRPPWPRRGGSRTARGGRPEAAPQPRHHRRRRAVGADDGEARLHDDARGDEEIDASRADRPAGSPPGSRRPTRAASGRGRSTASAAAGGRRWRPSRSRAASGPAANASKLGRRRAPTGEPAHRVEQVAPRERAVRRAQPRARRDR